MANIKERIEHSINVIEEEEYDNYECVTWQLETELRNMPLWHVF